MSSISVNINEDIDIDVDEFVDDLSSSDRKRLIEALDKNKDLQSRHTQPGRQTVMETEFYDKLRHIAKNYLRITPDDLETLETVFKKYL